MAAAAEGAGGLDAMSLSLSSPRFLFKGVVMSFVRERERERTKKKDCERVRKKKRSLFFSPPFPLSLFLSLSLNSLLFRARPPSLSSPPTPAPRDAQDDHRIQGVESGEKRGRRRSCFCVFVFVFFRVFIRCCCCSSRRRRPRPDQPAARRRRQRAPLAAGPARAADRRRSCSSCIQSRGARRRLRRGGGGGRRERWPRRRRRWTLVVCSCSSCCCSVSPAGHLFPSHGRPPGVLPRRAQRLEEAQRGVSGEGRHGVWRFGGEERESIGKSSHRARSLALLNLDHLLPDQRRHDPPSLPADHVRAARAGAGAAAAGPATQE